MVKISQINPQPSKICAIDASTNSLAFSIFENKELSSIGKINFKGATTYDKVTDAAAKTEAFFREYGIPDAVIIEHTVFMNSPKTAADLALVQGGLLGAMGVAGVKNIKSINPIAWQTFIGNGRLTHAEKAVIRSSSPEKSESWYKSKEREFRKERTIRFVNTIYDKKISDNDVADAIGIGHYAINNWAKLS
jgi:Holliday junction resolvasome RuvABC endonuclease subunit